MKISMWKLKRNLPSHLILFLYSLIIIVPVFYAVVNSFKKSEDIQMNFYSLPKELYLESYKDVLVLIDIFQGYKNNIIILFVSLILTVLLSSMAALAIAVLRTKALHRIYTMLVMIICLPIHAYVFQLIPLLNNLHLYNTYIGTSLIFTALSIPVSVFLYTGFAESIPRELYEAATVDGCDLVKTYRHVFMPVMMPVTCTVLILRGTFIWNNLLVSLVTITDPTKTMLIPRTYAFNSSTYTRWDLVLASSVLVSLPICIMYIFMQKFFVGGITAGAVKG